MKSPLQQLLLLTVFVGIGLWVGVKWFLGSTGDFSESIDIRSVAHEPSPAATGGQSPKTASDDRPSEPLSPGTFGAPEPMKTVEELTALVEAAGQESEQGDEEIEEKAQDEEAQEEGNAESTADDTQNETIALSAEELDLRERARQQRFAELGLIPEKPPEPTVAVDVSLIMPEECSDAAIARVPVGLKFRYESALIRGESLNALESLVALYRECEQGEFVLAENPLGRADATDTLTQMRFDEVKYFFIQHSVSIDAVRFPEEK